MNFEFDEDMIPAYLCKVCSGKFPKDDIHNGICLCCWDELDKQSEDSMNRTFEGD